MYKNTPLASKQQCKVAVQGTLLHWHRAYAPSPPTGLLTCPAGMASSWCLLMMMGCLHTSQPRSWSCWGSQTGATCHDGEQPPAEPLQLLMHRSNMQAPIICHHLHHPWQLFSLWKPAKISYSTIVHLRCLLLNRLLLQAVLC